MKTITLKVVLPKWARWVATDSVGLVSAFRFKPFVMAKSSTGWVTHSQYSRVAITAAPRDWRKTLRKIK